MKITISEQDEKGKYRIQSIFIVASKGLKTKIKDAIEEVIAGYYKEKK